jgi:hypothetical protein
VHDFQHFRFLGVQIDSGCRDDRFPSACGGDGYLDVGVLGAIECEAGVSRGDNVIGSADEFGSASPKGTGGRLLRIG